MTPEDKYLIRYLHDAAIAETRDKYQRDGYTTSSEVRAGDTVIDLVAQKDNEKIYFEFKVGKADEKNHKAILEVKRQAQRDEAEFRLVLVAPPVRIAVEIEDIEDKLFDYLMNDMPSGLDELSTHTVLDEVTDVEISSINIQPNSIVVTGTFLLGVSLQYGSASDMRDGDGLLTGDAFPADFEAEFNGELELMSLDAHVDTSSFYD